MFFGHFVLPFLVPCCFLGSRFLSREGTQVLEGDPTWWSQIRDALQLKRSWLMSVILAIQEAENRRIFVRSQPQGNGSRDPISKKPNTKNSWWSGSSDRNACLARPRAWVQTQYHPKKSPHLPAPSISY
jgi:hypothetical protein